MHLRHWFKSLLITACAAALAACASTNDRVLPDVSGEAKPDVVWRINLGEGPGVTYTRLKAAVDGDTVYAADTGGTVTAVELASGDRLWTKDLEQPILGGVSFSDNQLFVSLREGTLVALSAEDGSEQWRAMLPSEAVAQAAADAITPSDTGAYRGRERRTSIRYEAHAVCAGAARAVVLEE